MARISIYDTTLRDGSQGEGVNFSLQDKLRITQRESMPGSMMPEGLADAMTLEDFRALLSYLVSLKDVK